MRSVERSGDKYWFPQHKLGLGLLVFRLMMLLCSSRFGYSFCSTILTPKRRYEQKQYQRFLLGSASGSKIGKMCLNMSGSGENGYDVDCKYLKGANLNSRSQWIAESQKLSLAPMMEYTDRHFRHMVRLMSRHTLTYTEMVTAMAIVYEYRDESIAREDGDFYLRRILASPAVDQPCILQLGGSEVDILHDACQIVQQLSDESDGGILYTGVNLNCGCPSPKVAGKGCFGAAMMEDAELVRDVTSAMSEAFHGNMPISVKCRIGTDLNEGDKPKKSKKISDGYDEEEYQGLYQFIKTVSSNNVVTHFDIHARKAILTRNISPADNRSIPPLKYEYVTQKLVKDFPHLTFSLNGGIVNLKQVAQTLQPSSMDDENQKNDHHDNLVGCMIGRAFASNPWHFSMADQFLYGEETPATPHRYQLLQDYGVYADEQERQWGSMRTRRFLCKAVQNLFAGEPNGKRFRVQLDQHIASSAKNDKDNLTPISQMIMDAAKTHLSDEVLYSSPEEAWNRWLERENKSSGNNNDSIIAEWQKRRKQEA